MISACATTAQTHKPAVAKPPSEIEKQTAAILAASARLGKKKRLGYLLKFMQDNGLTRYVISATAPEIPDGLIVYYRDLMPEALEFDRQAVSKWYARFERNMHADQTDMTILENYLKKTRSGSGVEKV